MRTLAFSPKNRREAGAPLLRLHHRVQNPQMQIGAGTLYREAAASPTRKGAGGMGHEQIGLSASQGTAASIGAQRYRAFISYSHTDERAAARLHRWLESYRLPRSVVGRSTARGEIGRKLSPIFRDRTEFPASGDLHEEVTSALSSSACLVVLCSPAARASRWVNQEIMLFRSLHPDRPVLAALIDGEPADAFPAELIHVGSDGIAREPIAADFRRQGDGARLARLKIVAGITGLALDELVQRDAQRQLHRIAAMTIASVALVILLLTMLVLAVNARNEADRQRQQAEGLIEFMLTDLRSRLQGVGRLDILASVNERALAYYGEQGNLSSLPSESLERRARVLHAMGEDDQRRGDLAGAIAKFREAQRVTKTLLAAKPDDPARIYAHAQSEFWLGYTDFLRQHLAGAQPHFEQYLHLALQLTTLEPNNVVYLRELGYAEGNVCSLNLVRHADAVSTLQACRAALETMRDVAEASPRDLGVQLDLANRYAWLADALKAGGRTDQALAQRRKQAAILDKLVAADPKNASYRQDWILSRFAIATSLRDLGDMAASLRSARDARTAISQLTAADPDNVDWHRWRSRIEKTFPQTAKEN